MSSTTRGVAAAPSSRSNPWFVITNSQFATAPLVGPTGSAGWLLLAVHVVYTQAQTGTSGG